MAAAATQDEHGHALVAHLANVAASMLECVVMIVVGALVMTTQTRGNSTYISMAIAFYDLTGPLPAASVVELRAFAVLPECCADVAELGFAEAAVFCQ